MRPPFAPLDRRPTGPAGRPGGAAPPLRRAVVLWLLAAALPGCGLGVTAGKMLFGDPTETPPFESITGVDLTDGEHTVLVLAKSPELVKSRFPEIDQAVMGRVERTLRSKGVEVVHSDRALDWVEERGGVWSESHLGPIAEQFEVDYIFVVDLDGFSWHETHSPDLLRGRSSGWIRAYGRAEDGGPVSNIMDNEFESVYPTHRPESAGNASEKVFRERYLDRLCEQASRRFVPFHQRDTI